LAASTSLIPKICGSVAATCSDGLGPSLPIDPEVAVQPAHIRGERSRHALAFLLDSGHGANRREQCGSVLDSKLGGGATSAQISKQPVQAVDGSAAFLGQLVAPVGKQPEQGCVVLAHHLMKAPTVHGHGGDGDRIQGIGLAAVVCGQESSSSGERGGNVDDRFAGGNGCWASSSPRPDAPSTAQVRSGHALAQCSSRLSIALFAGTRS